MKDLLSIFCSLMAVAVSAEDFICPDTLISTYNQGVGGTIQLIKGDGCQDFTAIATPNTVEGYEFVCWEDNSTDNPRTYTYNGGDFQLRAVFGKTEDLHVQGGDIKAQVIDPALPSYKLYPVNASCGIFAKWSDESIANPLDYLESDGTRKPTFSYIDYLWKTDNHEGGIIKVTPLTCGFTFEAIPNTADGYRFAYWDEDKSTYPIRDEDWAETHFTATFVKGAVAVKNGELYGTIQDAVNTDGDAPVSLIESASENVTITKAVTLQGNGLSLNDLTIANGGDLTLGNELTANNLYLNSMTGSSSQLRNANNLTYNAAYVDIRLDPKSVNADPNKWYAFAVPFEVDVNSGVRRASAPDVECVNFTDYLIWEYDGTLRASNKENGWVKMQGGTLQPGRFYMIGVDGTQNIWRFAKKADAALGGDATVAMYEFASDIQNQGWNAVANSTLVYSNAGTNGGIMVAQVYENGAASENYKVKRFTESSFVMGSPFFVQTAGDDQLNLTPATEATMGTLYAPSRTNANYADYFKVQLLQNDEEKDVIFLTTSEDAQDEYTIGKDVMKMMGGNSNTYLYTNAYGMKLCAQDAKTEDGDAYFSLGMYAPQAGSYELNLAKSAEAKVYLMCDNFVIWNLSQCPYTLDLNKGTNTEYSLLIRSERGMATDIKNISTASGKVQKFINRGRMYINANGSIYDAQGQLLR